MHAPYVSAAAKEKSISNAAEIDPDSARVQLKENLRGKSFDEQAAALSPVQRKGGDGAVGVQGAAAQGVSGGGGTLPYADKIQAAFGNHDISNIQSYQGGNAAGACNAIGAEAYATGDSVAFKGAPTLHTAAHEAAHIVQQRAGVSLKGGVGKAGDQYEQHADAVADLVVQGKSAEGLLDQYADNSAPGVQQKAVQRKENPEAERVDFEATAVQGDPSAFRRGAALSEYQDATQDVENGDTAPASFRPHFEESKNRFVGSASEAQNMYARFEKRWKPGDFATLVTHSVYNERLPHYTGALETYNGYALKASGLGAQFDSTLGFAVEADRSKAKTETFLLERGLAYEQDGQIALDEAILHDEIDTIGAALDKRGDMISTGPLSTELGRPLDVAINKVDNKQLGLNAAIARIRAKASLDAVADEEKEMSRINSIISFCDTVGSTVEMVVGNVTKIKTTQAALQTTFKDTPNGPQVVKPDYVKVASDNRSVVTSNLGSIAKMFYQDQLDQLQATITAAKGNAASLGLVAEVNEMEQQFGEFRNAIMNLKAQIDRAQQASDTQMRDLYNLGTAIDREQEDDGEIVEGGEHIAPMMLGQAAILETESFLGASVPHWDRLGGNLNGFAQTLWHHTRGSSGVRDLNALRTDQGSQQRLYQQLARKAYSVKKYTEREQQKFGRVAGKFQETLAVHSRAGR